QRNRGWNPIAEAVSNDAEHLSIRDQVSDAVEKRRSMEIGDKRAQQAESRYFVSGEACGLPGIESNSLESQAHRTQMRTGAYCLAVGRVADATLVRGLFP
ncbi:MAG: hypothetical protein WA741_04780, partial [Candidatus Sulfotelmatobacter sp.]